MIGWRFLPVMQAVLLAALCFAAPARSDSVTIFAAASTKGALDEIAASFEAATGHDVTVSYAGSSALAQQIRLGAPADIFLSANVAWMDLLEEDGHLAPGTRRALLGNRLVLIGQGRDAPVEVAPGLDLAGMLGDGRLAMALVEAVPAGMYGKAALQHLGLWDTVADRVAQVDNVRAALALVTLGAAPLGIVYATDAAAEPRVRVLGRFPEDSHPEIVYPVALIAGHDSPVAREFLAWLGGPGARAVFDRLGFLAP